MWMPSPALTPRTVPTHRTAPAVPIPLAALGRDRARGANTRERGALEGGADGFGTCAAIGIDASGWHRAAIPNTA